MGFPGVSLGKESACNAGDEGHLGSIPGSGRSPGGENGNYVQYSCLETPHGQRSLAGYGVTKELDMTKHTHTSQFFALTSSRKHSYLL